MATPYRRHRHLMPLGLPFETTTLLTIEMEQEVATWLDAVPWADYAKAMWHAELLAGIGRELTEPYVKRLGGGLYELRFGPWRITFWFPDETRVVLLTVFRKQRMNERDHVDRAREALRVCASEHKAAGHNSPVFDRRREKE